MRWRIGGADKGRNTETVARWTSLKQCAIFTWIDSSIAHRSTMSKEVQTRAHLMTAGLQIHKQDNLTAKFLKREENCRSVLWRSLEIQTSQYQSPALPPPVH